MTHFPDQLDPSLHTWLNDAGLNRLWDVLASAGGEARVVGGAVRDALLGRDVGEIDLAVNLPPDAVNAILQAAHIKTVPTGLDHGTLTAVIDHKGYEITSLRRDLITDGRHATVTYTQDWQEDAARRDFTFNALYLDADGQIYDYCGGRQDLAHGHVRFIGEPRERIKEDILRILRFFRFHAWFGKAAPDAEGLAACQGMASLIRQLSTERIWREITKLLTAPSPVSSWRLMQSHFILAQILPEADNDQRLEKFVNIEHYQHIRPEPLRRLAALIPPHREAAKDLARRLKLSNVDALRLQQLTTLPQQIVDHLDPETLPSTLYSWGSEMVRDAALLLGSAGKIAPSSLPAILAACAAWEKPIFPIKGEDLLHLGIKSGPQLGLMLRQLESWWVQQKFLPNRDSCLAEAYRLAQNS